MMKMVLKLELHNDKDWNKALKIVRGVTGVKKDVVDMNVKKLTVIGTMDAVAVVRKLSKFCRTEILSVGPDEEPTKKEEKKEEGKKDEPMKEEAKEEEKKEELKKEEANKKEEKKKEPGPTEGSTSYRPYHPPIPYRPYFYPQPRTCPIEEYPEENPNACTSF